MYHGPYETFRACCIPAHRVFYVTLGTLFNIDIELLDFLCVALQNRISAKISLSIVVERFR